MRIETRQRATKTTWAARSGIRRLGSDSTLLLILNAHDDVVKFALPEAIGGSCWVRLIDTNLPNDDDLVEFRFGHQYEVTGRSLLLLILKPTQTKQRATDGERSFQYVVQALEEASSTPVAIESITAISEHIPGVSVHDMENPLTEPSV